MGIESRKSIGMCRIRLTGAAVTGIIPSLMDAITLLGLAAGTLTTASFVPQLAKAWRSRSTKDLSLAMYVVITAGISLWLVYGILISSTPIIIANIVTLGISLTILILKLKFR